MQVLDVIASEYQTKSESQASQCDAMMSLLLAVKVALTDQGWQLQCCTSHADAPMRRGGLEAAQERAMCVPLPDSLRVYKCEFDCLRPAFSAVPYMLSPCCFDQPLSRDVSGSGEAVAAPRKRWRSCRWRSRGCSISLWSCFGCRRSSELC